MSGKKSRKGTGIEKEMTKMTIDNPKSGDKIISLFPKRPPRTKEAPGKKVTLFTNLFKMSIKQNKPIYQNGVIIDIEQEQDKKDKKEGGDVEAAPKRLSSELRREVITRAIRSWLDQTFPDHNQIAEFSFVFDSNASVLYTLFNIFANPSSTSPLELRVAIPMDTIVGRRLERQERLFRVKIHKKGPLNIKVLFDFCNGTGSSDITLVQEHMRAINIILRGRICSIPANVLTAVNVFPFRPENQFQVSPGVLVNRGYSLSVRPTESGVALNVANTVGAFYEEVDLVDMLRNRFRVNNLNAPLNPGIIDKLRRELRNKQVEARHINYGTRQRPHFRKYRIGDIGGDCLTSFTLVDRDTREVTQITIQEYFLREYNVKLLYPRLPCIIDRGRKLPLEVCHLIDKQRVMRKMDPEETAEVIRRCAVPPNQHFDMLRTHVEDVYAQRQPLNDFGLEFEPKPIKVGGRQLQAIALIGKSGRDIFPKEGQYNCDREFFFRPATVSKWALTFLTDNEAQRDFNKLGNDLSASRFSELYCNSAKLKGVTISPMNRTDQIPVFLPEQELKRKLQSYFKFLNREKFDHAIIVLAKQCPDWVYRYLQYLEVSAQEGRKIGESWTRTSCIKYPNYVKKIIYDNFQGKMFLSNLWLKHNTKLGGINYVLKPNPSCSFLQNGYIFISVDVCHPAPGDRLIQSVAACVGMWNLTSQNLSYCTRLRVQRKVRENQSTIEHVGEIDRMVSDILSEYFKKNKKYPQKVVILRDGVSEGQYKIVLQFELGKVKAVLQNVYTKANLKAPPLSCIVVQKRHKIRFKLETPITRPKGPDYNIQPGTVVDSGIVHPTDFSFYLAPHKAIQGTSRPAHNYMILDEIGFSQDDAQEMIHALSYLSPRCNKSTSIPTPVNLADLAAERGKNIVISWNNDNIRIRDENERLTKLNELLSDMGDINYKNTLYYV